MRRFRHQVAGVVVATVAVGLTSSAALASSTSTKADTGANVTTMAQTSHQRGNVEVRVPPAVIASSDGLVGAITVGVTYDLAVPVWLAAGQPQTDARIDIVGAQVSRCGRTRLVAGAVTRLRCRIVPTAAAAATGLVVTVVVDVHSMKSPLVATFTHHVHPPATS